MYNCTIAYTSTKYILYINNKRITFFVLDDPKRTQNITNFINICADAKGRIKTKQQICTSFILLTFLHLCTWCFAALFS